MGIYFYVGYLFVLPVCKQEIALCLVGEQFFRVGIENRHFLARNVIDEVILYQM